MHICMLHVCMYVCMFVCVYVCMYVCMYVYVLCAYMRVCTCVCVQTLCSDVIHLVFVFVCVYPHVNTGTFGVSRDKAHFRQLLFQHVPPTPIDKQHMTKSAPPREWILMGFPTKEMDKLSFCTWCGGMAVVRSGVRLQTLS